MTNELDITPSPRVLRMLGEIDFAPWQCLAELIDNSIDAFIDAGRAGHPVSEPRIRIQLPANVELERGHGRIIIEDNASGMTVDALGKSVKAGYSGNDPVEKMGLFGMGFNISTARLGRRTEVWTATADSADWTAVVIDFDELEKRGSFHAPVLSKAKTERELDRRVHGTRIEISRLEPTRMRSLSWGAAKARTKKRLGKIYGRVMAQLGIVISYDGDQVRPWRHCVWEAKRSVPTQDFGNVPARIEIDEALPERRFCATCWVWLAEHDSNCPACGTGDNVINRTRRLKGWIGVQRYFDKEHYGFDLIRNGRVIEELDKSFFTFKDNESGDDLFEYPRDAMHWGGRLVGELEVDFVRVSHQKDSFDKLDPEWKNVVRLVRGDSPLQPLIAERMGYPRNTSPLAKLFAAYRKGIAGSKSLVPGDSNGVGLNSGLINDYYDRFYAGEAEYQSDDKWYELVIEADKVARGGTAGATSAGGDLPIDPPDPTGSAKKRTKPDRNEPSVGTGTGTREPDPELTRTYDIDTLGIPQSVVVEAYRIAGVHDGPAFRVMPQGTKVQFEYYPQAPFFEQSLETPTDLLIIDLAHHLLALASVSPRTHPVSLVAHDLRKRYFPRTVSAVATVSAEADSLLGELRGHYDTEMKTVTPIDAQRLSSDVVRRVMQRSYQQDGLGEEQALETIRQGQFVKYLDSSNLFEVVRTWPHLALDGRFFSLPFSTLTPALTVDSANELERALGDVLWLSQEAARYTSKDNSWRLTFARALASLRLAQSWRR